VRSTLIVRLLALTAGAAAAFPARAQDPQRLVIWGEAINADSKGLDEVVQRFQSENPGVRVQLLGMGAGAMNPQKLMTAIVGGAPPDIVRQDRFTIADWASRNAFEPLDGLIERDRAEPRGVRPEDYYPAAWEETQFEGRTYGIPIAADNRALFWNRDLFRKEAARLRAAGLDPGRAPQTWSETLAYSRALTVMNADGSIQRAGFIPNYGNAWLYLYSFQNNASFLSPDGRKAQLSSPPVVEALEFMAAGYEILGGKQNAERFESSFRSAENDPFLTGQVAMVITGDWMLSSYFRYRPKLDFGSDPAPAPDDRFFKRGRFQDEPDTFITWSGGFSYAIPRGAKNRELAWKFIKLITSLEGRQIDSKGQDSLEKSRGRRFIPRVSAHREHNEWLAETFAAGDGAYDRAFRTHVGLMPYARNRPATFAAQVLWNEHIRAADQALRKEMPPLRALQQSDVRVQKILDEVLLADRHPVIDLRLPMGLGIGVTLALLISWAVWVGRQPMGRLARSEARWGYLLVSPWIAGFVIFTAGPMIASLFFSFTQYNVLTEARWVGAQNYINLFMLDGELMFKGFANVFYLGLVGIPFSLAAGLAIALLLNQNVRGMRFYRTFFYLPSIVPVVASVILWMWILNGDPSRGLANIVWSNSLAQWIGVRPPAWLGEEHWTKPSLILMALWGAGGGMILWLAGLKGIPSTLYEASQLDGANAWQRFWKVTIPQLSSLIFFNAVMSFIGVLQTFDSVYIITKGENNGPGDSLLVPVYHLFQNGFTYFRMGYASALAWVIFAVILIITLLQFKLAPRWVHYEVDK
jgi:multiple sugar transport system permease protein